MGAHQSKIGEELVRKYNSGSISEDDFHRIVMWIDLDSNELGWYHDVEAQQAGQLVWPEIDFDRDNLMGTEHWLDPPDTPSILDTSSATLTPPAKGVHRGFGAT